jgi:RNA polymerase sigma-70 factor (ECF subfamily)
MIATMPPGVETIEQIASGNQDAMAQLYDETSSLVYGMALRIVRDPSAAEEVAMDVYLQVWRTARQYSVSRGSVKAWLATMARARAIDWLRSSQARLCRESSPIDQGPPLVAPTPGPEQAVLDSHRRRMIRQHMDKLPVEQCRLIEMSFFSGFSHSEIAERMDMPLGTVKSRIRQGMCQLRDWFQTDTLRGEAGGMN